MAVAIPIMMAAGAALSAYGAIQQGQAQKAAAGYNAQLNARNAELATLQANADAEAQNRRARQIHGAMVAGFGASGLSSDSTLDVLAMSAQQAALDEATIRYNGRLKAMGYHQGAVLDRLSGTTAEQQGYLSGASYFLTGIGTASATYASGQRRIPGTMQYTGHF